MSSSSSREPRAGEKSKRAPGRDCETVKAVQSFIMANGNEDEGRKKVQLGQNQMMYMHATRQSRKFTGSQLGARRKRITSRQERREKYKGQRSFGGLKKVGIESDSPETKLSEDEDVNWVKG
jgi:hypothetical protein